MLKKNVGVKTEQFKSFIIIIYQSYIQYHKIHNFTNEYAIQGAFQIDNGDTFVVINYYKQNARMLS